MGKETVDDKNIAASDRDSLAFRGRKVILRDIEPSSFVIFSVRERAVPGAGDNLQSTRRGIHVVKRHPAGETDRPASGLRLSNHILMPGTSRPSECRHRGARTNGLARTLERFKQF